MIVNFAIFVDIEANAHLALADRLRKNGQIVHIDDAVIVHIPGSPRDQQTDVWKS